MENKRSEEIFEKGFNMFKDKSIKVNGKKLDAPILDLGAIKAFGRTNYYKENVLKALFDKDVKSLREISNFFYLTSGIYSRVCNYFAFLYRYDWYVVPTIYDKDPKAEKILTEFNKILEYLDGSYIKKTCGDIALEVIRSGAYYGYILDESDTITIQQLPIDYCRSRYFKNNAPVVEFNMKFFDEKFRDPNYRVKILNLFPKEFAKGYVLYKSGKLPNEERGANGGGSWYLLDPDKTIKFNFNNNDIPLFVNAIPAILDLDAAQDLDRRKQMQQLLKILVQKLPMDKNGDLIFDVDEARDIHNNAVEMLRKAIGVDILTTFADVESINISDKSTTTSKDDLEKVERTVFNALGISQNLFNTDGNMSLDRSILNDESAVRNLLYQFNMFYDKLVSKKNKNKKKYNFKFYMLETTQYNYKEVSKMYKEQVQIGYSKMLPQIALGHSQSSILNTAFFENEILNLSALMIPPLMSSTLNGEDILGKTDKSSSGKTQNNTEEVVQTQKDKGGRPEKADTEKSDKTIQNRESMS